MIARPLAVWTRTNRRRDLARLRELCRLHGAGRIVVGWPLRLDGTAGEMAEEAARFAEQLRKNLCLPVELFDERLSSWEAGQTVADAEVQGALIAAARKSKADDRRRGGDSARLSGAAPAAGLERCAYSGHYAPSDPYPACAGWPSRPGGCCASLYVPYQGFPSAGVYVDIPHGASPRTIARMLSDQGVVRNRWVFEGLSAVALAAARCRRANIFSIIP